MDDKKTAGISSAVMEVSRAGLWDSDYGKEGYQRQVYGDDTTVIKGISFLNRPEILTIEDWGCGYGGVKLYLAAHQQYIGVDGSHTRFADKIADLENYISLVDAVFLRHVLDHNPNWQKVLNNALQSFSKRMVLILFTPFQDTTRAIREYPNWGQTGHSMWDIGFKREDITDCFTGFRWTCEENLVTRTGYSVEHIYYIER